MRVLYVTEKSTHEDIGLYRGSCMTVIKKIKRSE